MFFRSVDDAERYLEPVDVRSGEYVAYDASGRRLGLEVRTARRPALFGLVTADVEVTKISALDAAPKEDPAVLSLSLSDFLREQGDDATAEDDLQALVARCIERFGYNE